VRSADLPTKKTPLASINPDRLTIVSTTERVFDDRKCHAGPVHGSVASQITRQHPKQVAHNASKRRATITPEPLFNYL
jgi:hypothetical protein